MRTAIVFGATGLVGSELLKQILDDPDYGRVIIFVRRTTGITHEKLEEKIINFDELEKYFEFFIVNDVFWCLGSTIKKAGSKEEFRKIDLEYPLMVAKDGKAYIENFVLISALGADAKSSFFYNRIKGELENKLEALNLKRLIIVRPSLILGDRSESRRSEKIGQMIMPYLNPFIPKKNWRAIKASRIAEVMLKLRKGDTGIDDLKFKIY
ncbi:MAG: oxidoreductase [Epsilonproteobacteria bacterium]|nr:MAG: oxidoreductase [Campylobacterota bacterium]RLA65796.1 MAG: oxidoreductase [Campylobacterota bacterium]